MQVLTTIFEFVGSFGIFFKRFGIIFESFLRFFENFWRFGDFLKKGLIRIFECFFLRVFGVFFEFFLKYMFPSDTPLPIRKRLSTQ